jgi:hypothetical protein
MIDLYLSNALADGDGCWNSHAVERAAAMAVPDVLLGASAALLRCDIGQQWARWFVESFLDPRRCQSTSADYPNIFAEVWSVVNERFGLYRQDERHALASKIATIIRDLMMRHDTERKRRQVDKLQKHLLLELSGTPPRCYYCGALFHEEAINAFLKLESSPILLPQMIDVLNPRGLNNQDYRVEIDHVIPFSAGGGTEDNLVLSCGWCNRHKSAKASIYDVSSIPILACDNSMGFQSLPNPFWTVRLLAIRRKCEHRNGCSKSTACEQLLIAPINEKGALNPINLMITCSDHDPLRERRFHSAQAVKQSWGKRISL